MIFVVFEHSFPSAQSIDSNLREFSALQPNHTVERLCKGKAGKPAVIFVENVVESPIGTTYNRSRKLLRRFKGMDGGATQWQKMIIVFNIGTIELSNSLETQKLHGSPSDSWKMVKLELTLVNIAVGENARVSVNIQVD